VHTDWHCVTDGWGKVILGGEVQFGKKKFKHAITQKVRGHSQFEAIHSLRPSQFEAIHSLRPFTV